MNGTVRLYGKVDSQEARTAAASIAGSIEHVKAVKNELQGIAPRDRKTTDISDQEIARLVESLFAKTDQLTGIAVRSVDGVVILTGTAASIGASARASELARDGPGVRAVKNDLTAGGFFITALLGGNGDPVGFVMAVVGSLVLLAPYRPTIGRIPRV